ncbi:hypothetical protein Z959_08825 [Clostridium novyi B str. ATCC 27606]|uniref:Uncharacterized protein n=1 Tax=Clostridium novyi B str. ATCC 27606 TaxID=1443123 RepID=A0AA40IVC9_CLONO|nr:hypothetical protein [Clostridium novyi]KEI16921.1 hypothetical protein Z959_08825 [Clostridium novyi B str. ATCC 27606]
MEKEKFIDTLVNRITIDSPKYLKQKLVNSIKENKIGYYGKIKKEGICLTNKSIDEKLKECLKEDVKTIKCLDILEMEKGYKYSILYRYSKCDFDKLKNISTNIDTNYFNEYSKEQVVEDEILYKETSEKLWIKFHKYFEIINVNEENVEKKNVRYPIVIIFYKKLNMMEVRFDKLSLNKNYDFFKITMDTRLASLKSKADLKCSTLNLEDTIREIVKTKKDMVKQIIWSFEAAKSRGYTLKVGEDGVMPFVGELENLLKILKKEYKSKECVKCIEEMEAYVDKTKKFADEKFRILSWVKKKENNKIINLEDTKKTIDLKITFKYSNYNMDLINIYDNEINDAERVDYVIEFIGQIAKDIGEL